jgi:hypothetical protein
LAPTGRGLIVSGRRRSDRTIPPENLRALDASAGLNYLNTHPQQVKVPPALSQALTNLGMGVQARSHGSLVRVKPVSVRHNSKVSIETKKIDRNSVLIQNAPFVVKWMGEVSRKVLMKL